MWRKRRLVLVLGTAAAILQSILWAGSSSSSLIAKAFADCIGDWRSIHARRPGADLPARRLYVCAEAFQKLDARAISKQLRVLTDLGIRRVCSDDDLTGNCSRDGSDYSYLCLREVVNLPLLGAVQITESYNHIGGDHGHERRYLFLFGIWVPVWKGGYWVV
jgi:hypothetical protein